MPDRPTPPTHNTRISGTPLVIATIIGAALVGLIVIASGVFNSDSNGLRLTPPQQTSEAPATSGNLAQLETLANRRLGKIAIRFGAIGIPTQ